MACSDQGEEVRIVYHRVVYRVGKNPYDYKPRPNENMKEYFKRIRSIIEIYMTNEETPMIDFTQPARQAHVFITNLLDHAPYRAIKWRFKDVFVNGWPNTREYETDGVWMLTMDILKQLVVKAQRECIDEIRRAQDRHSERVIREIPSRIDRSGPSMQAKIFLP